MNVLENLSLPTLIFIAAAIPLTLVGLLIIFVRNAEWLDRHPRLRLRFLIGLGAFYILQAGWQFVTSGFSFLATALMLAGIAMIASTIYERRIARRRMTTQPGPRVSGIPGTER